MVGDPLAFVFGPEGVNIPWVSGVIAVSAIIAIATVLLVFQLGQPRLWMAMSRDGLLPKIFSSIHPRFRTPWFSTILTGFMVADPGLVHEPFRGHRPFGHRDTIRVHDRLRRRAGQG